MFGGIYKYIPFYFMFNRHLGKYYKKYAIFLIIGVLTLVAIDYVQLYVPEFLGKIVGLFAEAGTSGSFQTVINGRPIADQVIEIVKYTVILAAAMMIGRAVWRLVIFHASKGIEAGLRHDMFLKAEKLSVEYYHNNTVGTVMSWFTNDVETIEEFFGWGTVMIVDAFFLSILVIYRMLSYNVPMSLLIFIPLFLIVIWGALVEKFMSLRWEKRQEAYDRLYDFSQESFTGIRVIKAFVKEVKELHAFSKVAKDNQDANVKFIKFYALFDIVIEVIITLIVVLVLWLGGYFVYLTSTGGMPKLFGIEFTFTTENLATMLGYFDLIIWPMIALGQIISMYSRSKTSMKRIARFLDAPEDIFDKEGAIVVDDVKGEITFKNFTFTYPGENKRAWLQNINLTIKAGETIGIVGKIGSGKTTLANSLLRIYNVDEGEIFIDGHDIMDIKLDSLRKAIAYVPQDNFLFSDTIKRNIAFSDIEMSDESVKKAAQFACVDEDIEGFENKYETISGERGVTLSGGQKQRISIARAFIKDSPILIFDDSVSAVDTKTEESILKNIKELRKGKTTLVVSSRVSTVIGLDKIIVLDNGMLEGFDTPERLFNTSPTYKRMVLLQQLEQEKVSREGGK